MSKPFKFLEVMVLNYDFQNIMLWNIWFSDVMNKALWFWKRIIFGISDKIWFWVLKWYRIHGYEMECLFWFLKYNLFLNDRGVIITMGWQRDRDRIWTYSPSIPKTTLTTMYMVEILEWSRMAAAFPLR